MDRNLIIAMMSTRNGVALRKESVDRNLCIHGGCVVGRSLSARRAWIEIFDGVPKISDFGGRSPQGERG